MRGFAYQRPDHLSRRFLGIILGIILVLTALCTHGLFNYSIQNQLIQQASTQSKFIKQSDQPVQAIQEVIKQLPTESRHLLLEKVDATEQYQSGDRWLLVLANKLNDRSREKKRVMSGNWQRGFYLSQPYRLEGVDYTLLIWYPASIFADIRFAFAIGYIASMILFLVGSVLIYQMDRRHLERPLRSLNKGLKKMTKMDLGAERIEFISGQWPIIEELGETVMNLESQVQARYLELMQSEKRLSLLLDHLNLGVVLINSDGHIELINPEACEILGLNHYDTGFAYQGLFKSTVLIDLVSTVFDTNEAIREEIEWYVPKTRTVDVNIIPYDEPYQSSTGSVLVLLYDTSQLRKLENIRTEFVANASHELRTPVTSIKGFSETLLSGAKEDPEILDQFLGIILTESQRLERIIQDILELSRIETSDQSSDIAYFDVNGVVSTIQTTLSKKAEEKNIRLTLDLQNTQPLIIESNQHRLEQIVTNLLDNALNYSAEGQEVHVTTYSTDKGVVIEVSDNGIGIPEDDQERIFERFYRVDKGRSRHSGGTGLGLSIVRNLIRLLGGRITVDSQLGHGSTFTVYLPFYLPKQAG